MKECDLKPGTIGTYVVDGVDHESGIKIWI